MKRLPGRRLPRIFQFCKCFGPERGNRHLPEFSMLEWYSATATTGNSWTSAKIFLRLPADGPFRKDRLAE